MQILFSAAIEPSGNKTLTVPYGVNLGQTQRFLY